MAAISRPYADHDCILWPSEIRIAPRDVTEKSLAMNEANDLPGDAGLAGRTGVLRRCERELLQRVRELTENRYECEPRIDRMRMHKVQTDPLKRKGFSKWLGRKAGDSAASCSESTAFAEARRRHFWERGGLDDSLRSTLTDHCDQDLDGGLEPEVVARDAGAEPFDQGCKKYDRREALRLPASLETLPASSCLLTLKGGLEGPALVIVPGIAGRVGMFRVLAGLLHTLKTIYVVRSREFNGSLPADAGVEDMARRYLEEVRLAQPTGPYFLCGHSFGGLVAFEMARMLVAAGQQVAALILLAPLVHKKYWPLPYFFGVMVGRVLFHLGKMRHVPVHGVSMRRMSRQMEDVLRGLWRNWVRLRCAPPQNVRCLENAAAGPAEREIVTGLAAWTRYRPRFYPGKLVYVYPRADARIPLEPHVIWRHWAREVEVHNVPGGHSNILSPPYVGSLARDLDCYLARSVESADAPLAALQGSSP